MSADATPLGILLISGTHEHAHYAFVIAAAAAAAGRPVVLFATNDGCHALVEDWSALSGSGRDVAVRALGVAGLGELREAAAELGVRCLACEAGLRLSGLSPESLRPGVEVTGVLTFLDAVRGGQVVSL
jgi:peroxiredoxin family protein